MTGSETESSIGRRLYGAATLWQDWDQEATAVSPAYWELFVDLLLVAAASAISETFEEDQSLHGFYEFLLLYMAIVNGWLLYVHHYTSRFHESSLGHTCVLFFFLLGMAVTIVNASYETASLFSMGVIVQRAAWLVMIVPIGMQLPRARDFVLAIGATTFVSLLPHLTVVFEPEWAMYAWTIATIIDLSTEAFIAQTLPGTRLIPVNIEHAKDRLGVLVLVMLGETVISSTITYRKYQRLEDVESNTYYIVLGLSFLLIFMFSLLFFNVQPHPKDHAFRRSRFFGISVMFLNKWLGMTLLMVGTSVKLVVQAVAEKEALSAFSNGLLNTAVGASMILLLLTRLCHFGGRLPRPTHSPRVKLLMWLWWATFAMVAVLPFFLPNLRYPIISLACMSGLLLVFCIVEGCFFHMLEVHLPGEIKAGEGESQSLTGSHTTTGLASF